MTVQVQAANEVLQKVSCRGNRDAKSWQILTGLLFTAQGITASRLLVLSGRAQLMEHPPNMVAPHLLSLGKKVHNPLCRNAVPHPMLAGIKQIHWSSTDAASNKHGLHMPNCKALGLFGQSLCPFFAG